MGGVARGLGSDEREKMEGCSSLALVWHLLGVQMTDFIRNLEYIPLKIGCQGSF